MKRLGAVVLVLVLAAGLGACERRQVVHYKQGEYQGKPDNLPWENDQFKKDKVAWETAIKDRNLGQNEYRRIQ